MPDRQCYACGVDRGMTETVKAQENEKITETNVGGTSIQFGFIKSKSSLIPLPTPDDRPRRIPRPNDHVLVPL